MIRYSKLNAIILCAAGLCWSCTEDTGTLGIYDNGDAISTSTQIFQCTSTSLSLDSMRANSDKCYLGQIVDPETGAVLKADFVAQFHSFETGVLPADQRMVKNELGEYVCDSINLRLFFQTYYGSATTPFKLEVHELSMQEGRIMREDSIYYTNVDLENFKATPEEMEQRKVTDKVFWPVTKMFTPMDYTETDSALTSSTHYNNVNIVLPPAYGKRILNLYRTNPEYFCSSYQFVRNVCPGFYFKIADGGGAMMTIDVSSMDIYYKYRNAKDSVVAGVVRFAATGEVIQATHFEGGDNSNLVKADTCTYLKSPAGIGTVIKLPIEEIYAGHENDSIALASMTLTRYNVEDEENRANALAPCKQVAMIERSELSRFFERDYTRNPRSYAVASLSSSYNIYSFGNIGRLISYLYNKHKQNPDAPYWDEVVLVPVSVTTNSSNQVVSISGDMSITSTRLVGGANGEPLQLQVVYSSYNRQ